MKRRKLLSILLSICVILAFMPQMAFAAGEGNPYTLKEGTAGAGENEGPGSLIDGAVGTKWCVTDFESAYIIFSTDSPINVSGYSITTGNDNAENRGRNPKNWTLYGCNDYTGSGTDTWEKIHSVTKDTILQDENNKTYNFAFDKKETAYQYYKLEITAIQGGDVMQMSEFALTSCDHNWITSASVAPTCTAAGYTTRTCDGCGGTDYVYLKPVDHDFTGEDGGCRYCGYSYDVLHQGYVDENGISRKLNDNTTEITEGLTSWDNTNGGWYIVKSDVTLGNVTVSGDVHLILADGCTLTVNGNIQGGSLTIYGQNGGTGKLFVSSITSGSGKDENREGERGGNGGSITINGGMVNVGNIKSGTGGTGGSTGGSYGNGSNGGKGGEITINGGIVEADSITSGNGGKGGDGYSGGGKGGNGGSITINGGMVKVSNIKSGTGGNGGSAYDPDTEVSGGSGGKGGNITINGGIVEADSITSGTGGTGGYGYTKGGNGGNGGNIIINGGIVEVGSITSGSGGSGGRNGNDGIVVSIVINTGIVFQGNSGQVYGARATLSENFAIPAGKTLTIESCKKLIIPDGVTLNNNGTINNNGKIYVDGTFAGSVDSSSTGSIYYLLALNGASATGDISEYNSKYYSQSGGKITLTPDAPQSGYRFDGWEVAPASTVAIGEDNTFTMPSAALTVTAKTSRIQSSTKTDSVTSSKDGSVTVTLNKSITTSDSKTTATVADTVADQILAKLASSESKSVVIDASAGSAESTAVVISESALKKLAEVEGIEITLVTDSGRVVLDSKTLASVAASAGNDGQVTLDIETVEKSNNLLKVDISISTSCGYVTEFSGGKVTVTVVIDDELKGKNPVAVYIDDEGKYFKIGGTLNEDGTFTFVTGHFSTYAVMPEADADKVIKEQAISAVKKVKSTVTLSTKSVKRGIKVSVKIPASKKADKTGVIIYRSIKKNSGYAMYKKVKTSGSTYTITNTKNVKGNRLVKGKRYYYKARVYKVIDGKTYYGPMSSVKYIRAK